jgi:tetratricopeptide (TPR) repeat protein
VVDDVVVCDTGSTDGTLALLDACGARATAFTWTNDFAAARNAALAAHTGTWGLLLDADETLECEDPAEWRHWLARNASDVVFLVCRNLESGTGSSTVDNASSRLLRASECHWTGRIHEQMVRRDGTRASNSASDGARIIHDGYALRRVIDRQKVDRNAGLTQLELDGADVRGQDPRAAEPGSPGTTADAGRAHFERGRAEMLAADKVEAEKHFRLAVELLSDDFALLRRMAYCNLATLANEQGRHEEARDFAGRALDDERAYTQAALALAVAHLKLDGTTSRTEARRLLEATILAGAGSESPRIGQLMQSLRDEGLVFGAVATLLGGLLLESGEAARAVELLLPLAEARPSLFEAWDILRRALVAEDREWATLLAAAATPEPGALEELLAGLGEADREQLLDALRRRGVEDWQVSAMERTWQALQPELRRMSAAALVAAARQQEEESPELALRLWRFAGDEPHMRVGQARCLDAMGRQQAAAEALDGLDPSALEPSDTLFVVALAAELGDVPLAIALLDGLPAGLDEALAGPARQMRAVLTAA